MTTAIRTTDPVSRTSEAGNAKDGDAIRMLAAVEEIAPVLRADMAEAEASNDLTRRQVAALREAGLFALWTPEVYGGVALDPLATYEVVEALARIDMSVAWVVANTLGQSYSVARLAEEATDEMFRDGPMISVTAAKLPGRGQRVDGGYRVTASTAFGSLASHADWLWLLFVDAPEPGEADTVPVPRMACFPSAEVQVSGNWSPTGLRATGSHDYEVADTFVANPFVLEMSATVPPNSRFQEPLFHLPITANQLMIGALAGGAAQGALDWVLGLAQEKVPTFMADSLRNRAVAQSRLGRAQALLSAARAYARCMTAQMWAQARGEVAQDLSLKAEVQLASSFAVDASAEALELVRRVAGTSAIAEVGPLARVVRDMAVLTQHAFVSDSRYESVGQTMLGLESDWATLNA